MRPRRDGSWDVPWRENHMPGQVFAPNLTPDPETGLGNVPDDAIARAIREVRVAVDQAGQHGFARQVDYLCAGWNGDGVCAGGWSNGGDFIAVD